MIRPLFAGALVGFLFASSKPGRQMRAKAESVLTDLIAEAPMERLEQAKSSFSKARKVVLKAVGSKAACGAAREATPAAKNDNCGKQSELADTSGEMAVLDVEKAQELADKLGAKPSAPEDENLAPFHHDNEQLKSA